MLQRLSHALGVQKVSGDLVIQEGITPYRSIAQLEEFVSDTHAVTGSIPVTSTKVSRTNGVVESGACLESEPTLRNQREKLNSDAAVG